MRLSDEGLIEVFRQSGTFVSPIKLHDVYEGLLIRETLETAVVRQATRKFDRRFESRFEALLARQRECAERDDYDGFHALDEEFHRTISECSGTPRVWRLIISAKAQLDRVRRLGIRAPGQFQRYPSATSIHCRGHEIGRRSVRRERAARAPQRRSSHRSVCCWTKIRLTSRRISRSLRAGRPRRLESARQMRVGRGLEKERQLKRRCIPARVSGAESLKPVAMGPRVEPLGRRSNPHRSTYPGSARLDRR